VTRNKLTATALLVALLVAGIGIGISIDRWLLASGPTKSRATEPAPLKGPVAERVRKQLGLDKVQLAKLNEIIKDARGEAMTIIAGVETRMRGVHQRARKKIREMLRPEQVPAFEKMTAVLKQRFDAQLGRPGGGMPKPDARIIFNALDGNKDGKLTLQECNAASHPAGKRIGARFAMIDADKDGAITSAELEAIMKRARFFEGR